MTFRELYSKKPLLSNKDIIDSIRNDNREILEFVYAEYFQQVYQEIVKGEILNEEDARDIFHDAIMIICNNIRKDTFVLEYNFADYLFNVCRKLVLKRLRWEYKTSNFKPIYLEQISKEDEKFLALNPDLFFDTTDEEIKYGLFSKYFILLKEDCKKVLTMTFAGISYEEIAKTMGYGKGKFAKDKKYRCKEYLAQSIMKDKLFKQLYDE